jgi:phosphoenolpyruvate phosphomutase
VIVVPTSYYRVPTETLRKAGVAAVIWANHNLRASIVAMREVSSRIFREQTVQGVEGDIATLDDVFDLAGNRELAEAEQRYLPSPPTPEDENGDGA